MSAATFAPTRDELNASSKGYTDSMLDFSQMEPGIDSAGRRFYAQDDRLYPADTVETDNAFTGNSWPGGVVYYQFQATLSQDRRNTWRAAANGWSAIAPLTFVEGSGAGNYIFVQNSTLNNSYVGMIGGRQEMNISDWIRGVITHEIGHALGLEHEQSRSDRDGFVIINYNNILAGEESNFDRIANTVHYGGYDFDSIMHYERLAFSKNGLNTIEPRPAYSNYLYTMGTYEYPSTLDASGMVQQYGHPANDPFANRTPVAGNRGGISGSNGGAGKEPGEPNHDGNPGGASVWYTWRAPGSGSVTFDTYGSSFDTVLAVYRGTAVAALSYVASNDDSAGTLQSTVTFLAVAGVSYQIAVDGFSGATGSVRFNWLSVRYGRADFSGDAKVDLIWQNNSSGQRAIWVMDGTTMVGERFLPNVATQWQIAGVADFTRDGHTDIVWQNTSTGQRTVWVMNGSTFVSERILPTVPTQWQIASMGDFNGDSQPDLVWQNNSTGQRSIWLMNGTNFLAERLLPTIPIQWKIVGTGDFDVDTQTDLVWQNNTTGQRSVWRMNGTTFSFDYLLPNVPAQWNIAGTGDFNNDGRTDLIWQNSSNGQRAVWLMNGFTRMSDHFLPTVPTQWEIRNH